MKEPPTIGKPKRPSTAKPKDPPAPRKRDLEGKFCAAIKAKLRVELRYEDDTLWRLYDPHGVFKSTDDKILTTGTQIRNPNQAADESGPRHFEVGRISAVQVTDQPFTVDPRFDRLDPRYRNGFLCVV